MKNKLTVTIGIPVFNECQNIKALLDSIIKQSKTDFVLERILISCKGSTDDSFEIINKYSVKNKIIQLLDSKTGITKREKLNSFYKNNKSDIFISTDGDVVLGSNKTVEQLIKYFKNPKVGLVGGFNIPVKPSNFFEKVVVSWIELWNEIRINYRDTNNVHNHLGCVSALRKGVAKDLFIPEGIVADDDFIFFKTIEKGYEFRFSKNAKVYYKNVNNFKDFLNQHSRLLNGKYGIADYFGDWVFNHYKIEFGYKIRALLKALKKRPVLISLAILLQFVLKFKLSFFKNNKHNNWQAASSSKNVRYVL